MTDNNEVTGEVLIERARAMVPALLERARETETLRQLPAATIADAEEAGFFKAFVPKRHGGYEIDFRFVPQITRELAHGCLSSAWVISFLTQHNWQLALFPEVVQQRLWAERSYMFAPAHIIPGGAAEPVDGGYRLSGKWPWASGVMHAQWFLALALVPGDGPAPDVRYFLVPIEPSNIEDVWEVAGLAGTGSNTIVLDDIFVPDDMQISMTSMLDGSAPGLAVNDSYLWRIPMVLVLDFNSIVAASVGVAEAAHELFVKETQTKQIAYGGGAAIGSAAVQMRVGRCGLQVISIRNLLDQTLAKIESRTRSSSPLSEFERLEIVALGTHIIHTARSIVDEICEGAGSSFNFLSHPLQRMRRDLNVLATHGVANSDRSLEIYGKVLLGHDIPPEAIR